MKNLSRLFNDIKVTRNNGPRQNTSERDIAAPPGIEHIIQLINPPSSGEIHYRVIDYNEERIEENEYTDLSAFKEYEKPDWSKQRWIDITGVHAHVLQDLVQMYNIPPLAAEDMLKLSQRPKTENYDEGSFSILRMLRLEEGALINEQVSFFLIGDTLITIQEETGDVWGRVRSRMRKQNSRFRTMGISYLLYALIDAIVDHLFPLLDYLSDQTEKIEEQVVQGGYPDVQKDIHALKSVSLNIRRILSPMREVIFQLYRNEENQFSPEVKSYFRDVYDHILQAVDQVELNRETLGGVSDLYLTGVSNRMNEVMKVLTIMASLFIPITFIAGVYGMNFEYIPELQWKYSYGVFWGLCITVTASLLFYFKKKKWL